MAVNSSNELLTDLLCERGLLSGDQLRIGQIESTNNRIPLNQTLVQLGFVTESVLRDMQSELTGSRAINLSQLVPDASALELVPAESARRFNCLPVAVVNSVLTVAMAAPDDLAVCDRLRAMLGASISLKTCLAGAGEIVEAIDRFYGFELSIDGVLRELEMGDAAVVRDDTASYGHPMVRLVDSILSDAVKHAASDIHFEPESGFIRVRYRLDGVLRQIRSIHSNCQAGLAVRLKVLAQMDIAESRAPQDGRMSLSVNGRQIEFRVSTLPTIHGENIVLRILDRKRSVLPIAQLGLSELALQQIAMMMARPEGLILVTGPTGSGKTTTLYSILTGLNSDQINIMTMEDPVEYPLPVVRQSSVNEQVKLDFAGGIRAILRQDPDVILVGEIRDEETATMAVRAAMTGHQVYSTLHANSSIAAIARLADIGVTRSLLAGNLIGIVSQRLVRVLCDNCKTLSATEPHERDYLGGSTEMFRAAGCADCYGTGYRGRTMLVEVLRLNPELDELIAGGVTSRAIAQHAINFGYVPLVDDAIRCVQAGTTSFDEVTRVIDFTNRAPNMQ